MAFMQFTKPQHLMLPGPTPLPPSVLQAMAAPMINHRSELWRELYREVETGVKWFCQTRHDVVMFAGSGTTGMEAAITNLFSAGDRVLALVQGSFSERFAHMAETFGLEVDRLEVPWGQAIAPEALAQQLSSNSYKAVLLVHNETSTGVLNPLEELLKLIHEHECLSVVDGVSSVGSVDLPVDKWQVDVLITASQKGYMAPPGLSMLTISPRAWQAYDSAGLPRYSLDFKLAKEYAEEGWTPWTPPIPVFYALRAAFELLRQESQPTIWARHYRLMRAVRAGLQGMGLKLLVEDEAIASRAVTPVFPPAQVEADDVLKVMLNNYHILLGAGQRKMSGQLFRIGHLGFQDFPNIYGVLGALEVTLQELGHHAFEPGAGLAAAQAAARVT